MSDEEQPSVFERAARVFDGSDDPQTGLRVLKVATSDREVCPLVAAGGTWTTLYHQCRCFLDGGRRAFLYGYPLRGSAPTDPKRRRVGQFLMDLTTGEVAEPLPPTCWVTDASDVSRTASLSFQQETERKAVFWDLNTSQPLCSLRVPGWSLTTSTLLADGRRMLAGFHTGPWRKGRCHSQHYLLHADGRTEQILDADGYFCNHAVGCPADPDLYA